MSVHTQVKMTGNSADVIRRPILSEHSGGEAEPWVCVEVRMFSREQDVLSSAEHSVGFMFHHIILVPHDE